MKDVGYGASQILPIITTILGAQPGSIIIIEQPELHLHPKAQLKLAHLFLKAARRDLTILVETHSEHLLLQLCFEAVEQTRRTLERRSNGEQSAADLSENMMICFVSKEHAESSLTPIYLDDKGNLINETEEFRDFFVDDAKLVMSTLRSALEVEDLLQEGE